jgi:hypothetical protein
MLEQKLQQAEDGNRQRLIIYSLVIAVILLASALFMMISIGGLWQQKQTVVVPLPENVMTGKKPGPLTIEVPKKTAADLEAQRLNFISGLANYEKSHELIVVTEGFANWDFLQQSHLQKKKDLATTEFARGNYGLALTTLNELHEESSLAIEGFEAAYQESLSNARAAYQADAVEEAKIYIAEALSYKASEEALALSETVEKLQSVLDLIKLNNVAKVENNIREERRLSAEIFKLDPARVAYNQRVAQIDQQFKDERYEAAIAGGLMAFNNRDSKKLEAAVETALKIYPAKEETASLAAKLDALRTDLAFDTFLKNGNRAVELDNWQQANENFAKALALKSNNTDAIAGVTLSSDILANLQDIQALNREIGRLSNEKIAANAAAKVAEAKIFAPLSPTLANEIVILEQAIVDQNRPVEIVVISDKLASVIVRGVGQIGVVDRYRIELKPGTYLFEGRRDGYKAKIVKVEIKPTDLSVEVRVIPDERI